VAYANVVSSTFDGVNTTVIVEIEAGSPNLDNSLSAIAYGLIQGGGASLVGQSLPLLRAGMVFYKPNIAALTAQLALTDQSQELQVLNGAAAQTVLLPGTALLPGRRFAIENSGALAPPCQIASVGANIITTDQPHGLAPGQWFRVGTNALTTGVIPANLAAAVDYLVLTVPSPTTFTLATSWANYLAGTAQAPGAYAPAAGGQFHGQINPNQALLTLKDAAGTGTIAVLPPGAWIVLIAQHSGTPVALGFADWTIAAASPGVSGQGALNSLYGVPGNAPAFPNMVQFVPKVQTFGSASVTPATDTINYPLHGIPSDVATKPWWSMKFAIGSGLPAPLIAATEFYPVWIDANNYKVALTPGIVAGSAGIIDLTTAGGAGVTNTMTPQFHVAPWVQRIYAKMAGGGHTAAVNVPGAAGGYTEGPQAVTPNSTLAAIVGAFGGPGGTTSLVSVAPAWTMQATGGGVGGGGVGSGGTINLTGGDSGNQAGVGSSTPFGGAGQPGAGRAAKATTGSGGGADAGAGGNGADGQIVIAF
jgi:hypothetical protein